MSVALVLGLVLVLAVGDATVLYYDCPGLCTARCEQAWGQGRTRGPIATASHSDESLAEANFTKMTSPTVSGPVRYLFYGCFSTGISCSGCIAVARDGEASAVDAQSAF